jgi:serine/threonine-protein kinase
MPVTDRGACEWFVWDLRRSNLVDRGQLDQLVGEFFKKQPAAEPPALAQYLVNQGTLTQFQADRILQGKIQGLVLGPYTLVDGLGSGSMGTVYRALSKNDNKMYAVKVLPRRSMWNVRIARRHVRTFEQCQHPAVVPFADVGTSGGMHYLVWPLVEGETLDHVIERDGKMLPGLAAHYALQTAEGLQVCHQSDLVHGLLKPSNLMIGLDREIRILDFGIGLLLAAAEEESLVDTMSTANTLTSGLDCASPESILEPTNRTPAGDQYSLGCVLYFCLTGRYPFADGTAVEKMMAHQTKQPPAVRSLNPDVPEALEAVVDRLMQKKPENRFDRMADVVMELRPLAKSELVGTRSVPRSVMASIRNGASGGGSPPLKPAPAPLPTRDSVKSEPAPAPIPTVEPEPVTPTFVVPHAEKAAAPVPSSRFSFVSAVNLALLTAVISWLAWMTLHH